VVSINEDAHTENWGRFLLTMFFAVNQQILFDEYKNAYPKYIIGSAEL
jgi:hypothetical protein